VREDDAATVLMLKAANACAGYFGYPFENKIGNSNTSCMDYDHHHTVQPHRNTGVEAPLKGLEAFDTMRVKRVTMSVIHT
jgi:hypothetical protein